MQKETEKNPADLVPVAQPTPHTDGMNRQQRRNHEKAKLTAKGFKIAVKTMADHLKTIEGQLRAAASAGETGEWDLEPAFKALKDQQEKLKPYKDGGISREVRAKVLPVLQKEFDAFICDIVTANPKK